MARFARGTLWNTSSRVMTYAKTTMESLHLFESASDYYSQTDSPDDKKGDLRVRNYMPTVRTLPDHPTAAAWRLKVYAASRNAKARP